MGYFLILVASIAEVYWATALKEANDPASWAKVIFFIIFSFSLVVAASRMMNASMAYVIFVVLGAIGTYLVDVIVKGKDFDLTVAVCIGVMLFSVNKLKRSS